jgi:predicted enzyme related to lactoylglutathione lyase
MYARPRPAINIDVAGAMQFSWLISNGARAASRRRNPVKTAGMRLRTRERRMNAWRGLGLAAILCLAPQQPAHSQAQETAGPVPSIQDSTVMFYYEDISSVAPFYEHTLGLPKTLDQEWVKIYRLATGSYVGLVQQGKGGFHRAQKDNAVMLSIQTEDVNAWYEHMRKADGVEFLKEIYDNESVPIRAFLVRDPGGYSIEFYQWRAVSE